MTNTLTTTTPTAPALEPALVQPETVPLSFVRELAKANREVDSKLHGQIASLTEENANLRQENTELHELVGAQRAEIERLQACNRRLTGRLASIASYLRLMIAIYVDQPQSTQPSSN